MNVPDPAWIGQIVDGRFHIVRAIAAGGMGAVYEAEQLDLARPVAVKMLHAALATDASLLARFEREAMTMGALAHPNVAKIYDFVRPREGSGAPAWIVMELVDGRPLNELVREQGPFGVERAAAIILPVLSALDAAHAKGIIHRDLKPRNILVENVAGAGEVPRILDFGIAKLLDDLGRERLTAAGLPLGTPGWMAPEQARGEAVDARADVYAVGALLYTMLAGTPPFRGDGVAVVALVLVGALEPLAKLRPDLDPAMYALVARAMHIDPAQRYPSARALADALAIASAPKTRPFRSPSALAPLHANTPVVAPAPNARRAWGALGLGAVVGAALTLVAALVGAVIVMRVGGSSRSGERAGSAGGRARVEAPARSEPRGLPAPALVGSLAWALGAVRAQLGMPSAPTRSSRAAPASSDEPPSVLAVVRATHVGPDGTVSRRLGANWTFSFAQVRRSGSTERLAWISPATPAAVSALNLGVEPRPLATPESELPDLAVLVRETSRIGCPHLWDAPSGVTFVLRSEPHVGDVATISDGGANIVRLLLRRGEIIPILVECNVPSPRAAPLADRRPRGTLASHDSLATRPDERFEAVAGTARQAAGVSVTTPVIEVATGWSDPDAAPTWEILLGGSAPTRVVVGPSGAEARRVSREDGAPHAPLRVPDSAVPDRAVLARAWTALGCAPLDPRAPLLIARVLDDGGADETTATLWALGTVTVRITRDRLEPLDVRCDAPP